MGLILALLGVYGVVSYSTRQRTHEIGVRMALGARPGDIWRIVIRQGLAIVVTGALIGILAALGLTRVMAKLLFGVSAQDPLTYLGVTVLITIVTLAACCGKCWRRASSWRGLEQRWGSTWRGS